MVELNVYPCPEKPEILVGQPVGMYHCPVCGEMQLAGGYHAPPQFLDSWDLTPEQREYFEAEEARFWVSIGAYDEPEFE